MTELISKTRRAKCDKELDNDTSIQEHAPCGSCGEIKRSLCVCVSETIELHDMFVLKHKILGRKRPVSEITTGHDFHKDSKTWRKIEKNT
jgi:hypothetical protein